METTASQIVDYRNELVTGGIAEDEATFMARDAAARVIQANGLQTRATDPPADKR